VTRPAALLEVRLLDLIEFVPHQGTLRTGSFDAAETESSNAFSRPPNESVA